MDTPFLAQYAKVYNESGSFDDAAYQLILMEKHMRDPKTGLWYQILDQGNREGNYLEAPASSRFVCALAKGVNKDYLDKKCRKVAEKDIRV